MTAGPLLLAADAVALYPPGPADVLGWATEGVPPPAWEGTGNLQLAAGMTNPRATEGGGFGPFSPARAQQGVLYLPAEAAPADGMTAECRGIRWALGGVRLVVDPSGGDLTCFEAIATQTSNWPPDG
jgi:hypothetical protein